MLTRLAQAVLGAAALLALPPLLQPAHAQSDACAAAPMIGVGSYSGTLIGATPDGWDNCNGNGPDVWYAFTAPSSGTLVVDTCGTAFDTVVSVHSGCPGHVGTMLGCNDDAACGGGFGSRVAVEATAGATYRIRVTGFAAQVGAFTLNVAMGATAPSDGCADANLIGPGTFTGTTVGAAHDATVACDASPTPDVWYEYLAPVSGTLTVDTCGSAFDTVLSVFGGCPSAGGFYMGCDDDGCGLAGASRMSVAVSGGGSYRIRVSGWGGASGAYTLHVGFMPDRGPTCGSNGPLVREGTFTGTTQGVVIDGSSPCDGGAPAQDVWYWYTPSASGTLTAGLCGSAFDTVLSVHSGCPGNAANTLACNDDGCGLQSRLIMPVTFGTLYRVRVSGFNAQSGPYTLTLELATCEADWDGNGRVNSSDISAFLTSWLGSVQQGNLDADFNGNGSVNSSDISAFLTAWLVGVQTGC